MTYPPAPGQPAGYPPPPPPAFAGPPGKIRFRGRVPRLLGWIFLALAVVLFVVGGIVATTKSVGKVDGFQRVDIASGSGSITLDDTGKWVGYYESSEVDDSIERIPNFRIIILDPSGNPVSLEKYGDRDDGKVDKLVYDHDGHQGAAALQFDVDQEGTYQVRVQAMENLPADADVAFGRDIKTGTIVAGILILLAIVSLVAAIVLLIVGFVKRHRHKRELESGFFAAPPPPQVGGPGLGGPPGGPGFSSGPGLGTPGYGGGYRPPPSAPGPEPGQRPGGDWS